MITEDKIYGEKILGTKFAEEIEVGRKLFGKKRKLNDGFTLLLDEVSNEGDVTSPALKV